jgi:hypothetical protein
MNSPKGEPARWDLVIEILGRSEEEDMLDPDYRALVERNRLYDESPEGKRTKELTAGMTAKELYAWYRAGCPGL